jgi:putative ABC transport system permease protein
MRSDKRANRFMLGILIFIIFIGVLNTVLMSVLERTREFGVIRAIGSRPSTIVQLIFVETMMLTTLCLAVSIILLVPILGWLVNVGFSLPEPVDLGGMTFSQIRGGVTPLVLLAPVAYIYSFTALVTILPAIRAASVTPKTAMGSH